MTTISKAAASALFAAGLGLAIAGNSFAAQTKMGDGIKNDAMMADAMKKDAMMADCMKKAKLETNSKKMKAMVKACKSDAMHSGAMAPMEK